MYLDMWNSKMRHRFQGGRLCLRLASLSPSLLPTHRVRLSFSSSPVDRHNCCWIWFICPLCSKPDPRLVAEKGFIHKAANWGDERTNFSPSPWRWGVLSIYGIKLNMGKVTGDKKRVKWSSFSADVTKPQMSSWAPCSENVASVWSEGGVLGPLTSKGHHADTHPWSDGGSVDLTSLNQLELKLDTADSKFLNSAWPTSFC